MVYKWCILLALLLLSYATVSLLSGLNRFYSVNEQLIDDGSFILGAKHWADYGTGEVAYTGAYAALQSGVGRTHTLSQSVAVDSPAYLRLTFQASNKGFHHVDSSKTIATVVFRDAHGVRVGDRQVNIPVTSGTQTVRLGSIKSPGNVKSVDVKFTIRNTSGTLIVGNPVLSMVGELPLYQYSKTAVVAFWVLVFIWIVVTVFRSISRVQALSFSGTAALIVLGMLLPDSFVYSTNESVARLISAGGGRSALGNGFLSNIQHFGVFFILGVYSVLMFPRLGIVFTLVSIGTFAYFTEALQLLVTGRTSSSQDLLVDLLGGGSGVLVGSLVAYFLGRFLSNSPPVCRNSVSKISNLKVRF